VEEEHGRPGHAAQLDLARNLLHEGIPLFVAGEEG
jgi:hypothetical protein